MGPNERVAVYCRQMIAKAQWLRIAAHETGGSTVIDCGVEAPGGLEAGRLLASVCLAALGQVSLAPPAGSLGPWPRVCVQTDHPLAACMASQYAGWQIARDKYFAMASGPMRALAAREPLFEKIGRGEREEVAVGVLETSKLPPAEVCAEIAEKCGVEPSRLTLLCARTASLAGTLQVVARSVETALHKLFELGFDLRLVEAGFGTAPLPPVARNDLLAMGRTNDAILYGGEVLLWVGGDERTIETLGPRVPSETSPDYGRPFVEVFERAGRDFYKIDPGLFAPAALVIMHAPSGRTWRFGRVRPEIVEQSFTA